jgi:hypothetical protein
MKVVVLDQMSMELIHQLERLQLLMLTRFLISDYKIQKPHLPFLHGLPLDSTMKEHYSNKKLSIFFH